MANGEVNLTGIILSGTTLYCVPVAECLECCTVGTPCAKHISILVQLVLFAMSEICGKKGFLYLVLGLIPILILLSITNSRISQHSPAVQQLQSVENNAVRFNLPAESEAKCLDGSQPAYYLHRGSGSGKHKWLVFFEGGGWCYDLQQCYLRSKTTLGSSNEYPPHMTSEELRFYFSGSQVANPAMHDWNIVYVRYCDGSSYAGDATNTYKVPV